MSREPESSEVFLGAGKVFIGRTSELKNAGVESLVVSGLTDLSVMVLRPGTTLKVLEGEPRLRITRENKLAIGLGPRDSIKIGRFTFRSP